MKILVLAIACLSFSSISYSQTDTIRRRQQKGLLFLTKYNYQYDSEGTHIRPLGFHDFYYPTSCLDVKCILDSNLNIVFKNGIRIKFINGRYGIKTQSFSINCIDSSQCYQYSSFYIVPVTMDYKMFEDYEPYVCDRNYYELQVVGGSRLRFEYLHKALIPINIKIQKQK